jgi:hypothetical protein
MISLHVLSPYQHLMLEKEKVFVRRVKRKIEKELITSGEQK